MALDKPTDAFSLQRRNPKGGTAPLTLTGAFATRPTR